MRLRTFQGKKKRTRNNVATINREVRHMRIRVAGTENEGVAETERLEGRFSHFRLICCLTGDTRLRVSVRPHKRDRANFASFAWAVVFVRIDTLVHNLDLSSKYSAVLYLAPSWHEFDVCIPYAAIAANKRHIQKRHANFIVARGSRDSDIWSGTSSNGSKMSESNHET
jgi:hypothetical protein